MEVYFELDVDFSKDTLPALLSCDAVHLSGGNTFYFLRWLRRRAMLPVLRDYVARGGVLIGVSAGAILMTPDVSTSALCGDTFVEEFSDPAALGLVDFQFLPHFEPSEAAPLRWQHINFGPKRPSTPAPMGAASSWMVRASSSSARCESSAALSKGLVFSLCA